MNYHLNKTILVMAIFGLLAAATPSIASRCVNWHTEGYREIYQCSTIECYSNPRMFETEIMECNSWCCPGAAVQYDVDSCEHNTGFGVKCCVPKSKPWVDSDCPPIL